VRTRIAIAAACALAAVGLWSLRPGSGDDAQPPPVRAAFGGEPVAIASDPLLVRARREAHAGGLSAQTREALARSTDPAHARALRVLGAMTGEATIPESTGAAAADVPPVVVAPSLGVAEVPPTSAGADAASATAATGASGAPAGTAGSSGTPPSSPRPTLETVGLRPSSTGATLTLVAGSGVVVGVANQRSSGIVRLIVEAGAQAAVLSARPRVEGARVSSVKRVGRSVFVTLDLDPGWTLEGIRRTKKGAAVDFRRPS
jgi:hypothetical protein